MNGEIRLDNISSEREYYFQEGCYIWELLNDEQNEDVSIARARVSGGQTTCWHSLKDTVERYVIMSGQGLFEGESGVIPVSPGDVISIAAGARQRIENIGSKDLVFLVVCTPRFRAENYLPIQ